MRECSVIMTIQEAQENYLLTVDVEKRQHDASILDIPEMICTVQVKPFTPRMYCLLGLKQSPIIKGGQVKDTDLLLFMGIVTDTLNDEAKRKELVERLVKIEPQQLLDEITTYYENSFIDAPTSNGKQPFCSSHWLFSIVDLIASAYGWSEETIINLPFKRIWNYVRAMQQRSDPNGSV